MLLIFRRTTASFRSTVLSPLPAAILKPYSVATEPLTKPQLTTLVLSQYHQGKFSNLLQNVISSPSLLLTACHNLIHHGRNSPAPPTADSLSPNFFSIMTMAEELSQNRFDFDSCFLKMANQDEFYNNQTVSLLFVNQDWGAQMVRYKRRSSSYKLLVLILGSIMELARHGKERRAMKTLKWS